MAGGGNRIGYAAMLEQFGPREIVELSVAAEGAGFSGVMAADHFQPWVPEQGNAPFVWEVMALIGAMDHWVAVLEAPLDQASTLLHQAALGVLSPVPLALTSLAAVLLAWLCRRFWHHPDSAWRLAASAMAKPCFKANSDAAMARSSLNSITGARRITSKHMSRNSTGSFLDNTRCTS